MPRFHQPTGRRVGRPVLHDVTLQADGAIRLPRSLFPDGVPEVLLTFSGSTIRLRQAEAGEIGRKPSGRQPGQGVYLGVRRLLQRMGLDPQRVAGHYVAEADGPGYRIELSAASTAQQPVQSAAAGQLLQMPRQS